MTLLAEVVRKARGELPFTQDEGGSHLEPRSISLREFARRANVSHTQVSRIEDGSVVRPSVDVLTKLSRALAKQPVLLRIVAGNVSGEDAQAELRPMFHDGAELRDCWGDWCRYPWDEAMRIVRDPAASHEDIALVAADALLSSENHETLWEPHIKDDVLLVEGPGQSELRAILATWRYLPEQRRSQLAEYAASLRRLQELEELAEAEEWRLDVAASSSAAAGVEVGGEIAPFDEAYLVAEGFEGFARLLALPPGLQPVPQTPGVYVVVRRSDDAPSFLERSVGGHFKGEDPTVPVARLEQEWIAGAHTVYIGRAANLRTRIGLLARYGQGAPVAHRGGRLLWQLADHEDLLIAWAETPDQVAREADLVRDFEEAFGRLPFANLNRPGGGA